MEKQTATIEHFMPAAEVGAIKAGAVGSEEADYFIEKWEGITTLINEMPCVYEQDGKGEEAIVYLHYFYGNMNWYILERDFTADQYQAYGYADLGYGAELGYISIAELIANGVELDLHWEPKPVKDVI